MLDFVEKQKGGLKMIEQYRKAIHKLIDKIEDEKLLKKIYSYVLVKIDNNRTKKKRR